MIEHRVYFKLKPQTTQEQFEDIYTSILSLKNDIPGIISVDFKKNSSTEGKDRGCKDFFVMMFENACYLQDYLGNPRHKSVALEHFRPYVDEVLVFDNVI